MAPFTIAGAHLSSTVHSAEQQSSSTKPVDVCMEHPSSAPDAVVNSLGHSSAEKTQQVSLAGERAAQQDPASLWKSFLIMLSPMHTFIWALQSEGGCFVLWNELCAMTANPYHLYTYIYFSIVGSHAGETPGALMQRYTVSLSGGPHDAEGHTRGLQQDSSAGSAAAASLSEADGNAAMPAQQEQSAPALPGTSDTEVGIEDSDC